MRARVLFPGRNLKFTIPMLHSGIQEGYYAFLKSPQKAQECLEDCRHKFGECPLCKCPIASDLAQRILNLLIPGCGCCYREAGV